MSRDSAESASVVVVIVNWNGYDDTAECLGFLRSVTYEDRRTVVVDNGSADNEASRLADAFPEIHIITNEANEGFARAANQGIEWALGQEAGYVLLLNNDTVPDPSFLTHMIDYMKTAPGVGLAAPLITYYDTGRIWFAGGTVNLWTGRTRHIGIDRAVEEAPAESTRTQYATGCALLARAEMLREIGTLDDAMFIYYEDVDLSHRAHLSGYGIAVVPSAIVAHKVSSTLGEQGANRITSRQAFYLGRNKVLFAHKHLRGVQHLSFVASTATLGLAEIVRRATTWRAPIAYARGVLTGIKAA